MLTILKFRTLNRILALISILLLLIMGIPAYFLLKTPQSRPEAAWYDDSYAFRQRVSFTHNAAIASPRRVSITITTNTLVTSGQMQSDCDDTRFTDINGKLLRFQLVSGCNSASTVYDVVFPTINNGDNVAYFYYGNPSAVSGSDNTVSDVQSLTPSGSPALGSAETGPGPFAYWRFDEGTGVTAYDHAPDKNHGTLTNGPVWQSWADCLSGNCVSFDGNNDYINVPDNSRLNFGTDNFTVSLWFKTNSDQDQYLITKRVSCAHGSFWSLHIAYSNLRAEVGQDSGGTNYISLIGTTNVMDGKWHHAAMVRNGNSLAIYLDGKKESYGTAAGTANISNSAALTIAQSPCPNRFQGNLDEIKIYRYARSESEIVADYQNRGSIKGAAVQMGDPSLGQTLSNGLVGYWKMDETSANLCTGGVNDSCDSSGNGNDGAWNGDTANTNGIFGRGTSYDGSGDYISLGDPSTFAFGSRPFTLSAWVFFSTSPGASRYTILGKDAVGAREFLLTYGNLGSTNDHIRFSYFVGGTEYQTNTEPNVLTLGRWNLVTATRDGANTAVYVNGALRASSSSQSSGSIDNTTTSLDIGRRAYTGFLDYANGTIDEVRIYNRALSSKEVEALYDWAPAPIGHWKMDENTGNTILDSAGVSSAGTFTSMPANPWASGRYGPGLKFDGTDDVVRVPETPTTDIGANNQEVTLSAWIRTSSTRQWMAVVAKRAGAGPYPFYLELYGDGLLCFSRQDSFDVYTACDFQGRDLRDGRWHYVTGLYNARAEQLQVYIDGVLAGYSFLLNYPVNYSNNYDISIGNAGLSYSSNDYEGVIDDVRLYDYARTAKQITEDMNAGHPAGGSPVASQILYWKLDESAGSTVYNANPLHQTLTGNVDNIEWHKGNSCKVNSCVRIYGNSGFINAGDVSFTDDLENMTITMWLRPETFTASGAIVHKDAASQRSFRIESDATNTDEIRVHIYSSLTAGVNTSYFLTSNLDLQINVWDHLAIVYDGTQPASLRVKVYKNGKPVSGSFIGTIPASMTSGSTSQLRVGDYAGPAFSGNNWYYDELKIYNIALNQSEIAIDTNAGSSLAMGAVTDSDLTRGVVFSGSPLLWWKLDENRGGTVYDTSGSGRDGDITGSVRWVQGRYGSAIEFDGSASYVNYIGNAIGNSSAFTISFWIKYTTLEKGIALSEHNSTTGRRWRFVVNDGGSGLLEFQINDDSGTSVNIPSVSVLNDGRWHHIMVIQTSKSNRTFYVDGVAQATNTTTLGTTTYNRVRAGIHTDGIFFPFEGAIDDVRLFNYVLSPAEIRFIMNNAAPTVWYKFDECQGNTAYNNAENLEGKAAGMDGEIFAGSGANTAAGSCGSGNSAHMWNDGTVGKYSSALGFDGSDDYVSVSDHHQLDLPISHTISAWVYPASLSSIQIAVGKGRTAADTGYNLGILSGGTPTYTLDDGTTSCQLDASVSLSTGRWYHLTATSDGSTMRLFVDGTLSSSRTCTITSLVDSSEPLNIGRETSGLGRYFTGLIDDVRIYRYPLTSSQARTLYNQGSAVRFGPP